MDKDKKRSNINKMGDERGKGKIKITMTERWTGTRTD